MQKQRFSLRKYKFGLASVFLGTALVFGAGQVQAAEQPAGLPAGQVGQQVTDPVSAGETSQSAASTADASTAGVQADEQPADSLAVNSDFQAAARTDSIQSADGTAVSSASSSSERLDVPAEAEAPSEGAAAPASADESDKDTAAAGDKDSAAEAEAPSASGTQPVQEAKTDADRGEEKGAAQPADRNAQVTPSSISSNQIIAAPAAWTSGYKGEGTVVAIIDSGLDVEHEVLRITDISKAKYQDAAAVEEAKKRAGINYGKWYNDKVVYAYNYMDANDTIKEIDSESHGMHVTGIAAGNPDKKEEVTGDYVYGVAPEAQVLFMRVFSDQRKSTSSSLYVKAINDAVALGADSINLSLGSDTGSVVNAGPDIIAAIERARAQGVSVILSAGNANTFGNGYDRPLAENPDYGLVGNPSTVEGGISVASVNDTVTVVNVFEVRGLEDNDELNRGKFTYTVGSLETPFEKGREYDYVYVGLGRETDFDGLDLTGKLALIQRGSLNFTEKISNAIQHGAVGAVVYNNVDGADVRMSLDEASRAVPSVFISKSEGEALRAGNYKLVFDGNRATVPNPTGGELSNFTSWGMTADGQLKPDVTAPGGEIYSSLNDNSYGIMGGTSMAAPHVAGVAALVKEYLVKTYPDKSPAEVSELVKALIMSTAKIHTNAETGAYTSPRQQGAGIVDTAAAVSTDLYVTGEDNYPSVTLGNVGDSFTFDVVVHNISDQDRTLKMIVNTNTDTVADGHFTLTPRKLTETVWPEVTVKAGSSERVAVKVDASRFAAELSRLMPNGYYLEGFVRFVDPADDGDVISLPFVGFRGEFQNLPVAEQPIYNLLREGRSGFYYEMPDSGHLPLDADVTDLVTNSSDVLYATGTRAERSNIVLGTVENEQGLSTLLLDADGNIRLAISPNGDGNQDSVRMRGVFYRNFNNLKAAVYAGDDTEQAQPIWQSSSAYSGRKNYYDSGNGEPKSYLLDNTVWDGRASDGRPAADGLYTYVVRYTPEVPGAAEQEISFKLQIDTQRPLISSGYIRTENGAQVFRARQPLDVGAGGIRREQVFYLQADSEGNIRYQAMDDQGIARIYEHRVYIAANTDGSYTLPEGVSLGNVFYLVEDFAGNKDVTALSELVGEENSGRIRVALVDADSGQESTSYSYRIKDADGNYVDINKDKQVNFLSFGRYTAELFAYNAASMALQSPLSQEFELTAENSFQLIQFLFKDIVYAPLSVAFDQAVPKNTQVVLKNAAGEAVSLPAEKYGKNSYGRDVAEGLYSIIVSLPTGYELWEENPTVLVKGEQNNQAKLTVIIKTALIGAVNQQAELIHTARYYNAAAERRTAYDQAYEAAQAALTGKVSQSEVNRVLAELATAADGLDGQSSDVAALKTAIEAYAATTQTGRYANAKERTRQAYDRAFQAVALLAVREEVTQAQIDAALSQLSAAEQKLDGRQTDFSGLQKLIETETRYQAVNNRFIYASESVKAAYLAAFEKAKATLANPGASQADVKEAAANLRAAKRKLDGKKPRVGRQP